MVNRHVLTREQAFHAMENGEFPQEVTASAETVVVIMTQDWCPQWQYLKNWVYNIQTPKALDIYELVYNQTDYFRQFAGFKENKWNNDEIPYLRYYKDGKLIKETNSVSSEVFRTITGI